MSEPREAPEGFCVRCGDPVVAEWDDLSGEWRSPCCGWELAPLDWEPPEPDNAA